ncbi:MAG: hypothetical protein SFV19_05115 [Rhodospirillaceae bacterium]|nr:hypothetical protein [Rhodospirillaceae bacterium]
MNAAILLGLISAAAIALVIGHGNRSQNMKLLLGGIAVAAGIVALALLVEGL